MAKKKTAEEIRAEKMREALAKALAKLGAANDAS